MDDPERTLHDLHALLAVGHSLAASIERLDLMDSISATMSTIRDICRDRESDR